MALADRANQYVDMHKPWTLAKDPARSAEVLAVCTQGINLFRVLMSYLAPVLPQMACSAAKFLNDPLSRWDAVETPLLASPLGKYEPLAIRLDPKQVAQLIEPAAGIAAVAPTSPAQAAAAPAQAASPRTNKRDAAASAETAGNANIADFTKLDLRVARVIEASLVEGSDKLLQLTLDIRAAYSPEQLVGRHVLMIYNLEPRKMRFGVSEGMVLCASGDGPELFLLSPDAGAAAGMRVT